MLAQLDQVLLSCQLTVSHPQTKQSAVELWWGWQCFMKSAFEAKVKFVDGKILLAGLFISRLIGV